MDVDKKKKMDIDKKKKRWMDWFGLIDLLDKNIIYYKWFIFNVFMV